MMLSAFSIGVLRSAGLFVGDAPFFPETHLAYPNGYRIVKPAKAGGNVLPGHESWFTNGAGEDEMSDAPSVTVWFAEGTWFAEVHEWVPGPGPGDFRHMFQTEEEVVRDVIFYFFDESPEFKEALDDRLRT